MDLPIEIVPNSRPIKFRWKEVIDSPDGRRVVNLEGTVPPGMAIAIERLISIATHLIADNVAMNNVIKKRSEQSKQEAAQSTHKKGK